MKVILTENVRTLGSVGETVRVSEGYARNFLIPGNFAIFADESNSKQFADQQRMLAKKIALEKEAAQAKAKKISGLTLAFVKKVGGNGRLFGTLTNAEIAKALESEGLILERRCLHIESPIKSMGTYDVKAKLFDGVEATFKVRVEMDAEQAVELQKRSEASLKKSSKKAAKAEAEANAEDVATEE